MSEENPPGSEWSVAAVEVMRLVPIEGADRIEVAFIGANGVTWDYPVVVPKGAHRVGGAAVYVPVDSALPDEPEFAFIGSDRTRLRAKRLRGVYSEGLLLSPRDALAVIARKHGLPAGLLEWSVPPGVDVAEILGITRWRPPARGQRTPGAPGSAKGPDESVFPSYRVANAKKGEGLQYLPPDTVVVVTEKIHGANIRFGLVSDDEIGVLPPTFYLGSHNGMRTVNPEASDWWNTAASAYDVEEIVRERGYRDFAFYGEVYGTGVQDLTYGAPVNIGMRVFALYNTVTEEWCGWDHMAAAAAACGFETPPVLWRGPISECPYRELAEGKSTLPGATHVREGVVIHCAESGGPRRTWKYVGNGYRLRKGEQADNEGD